MSRIKPTWVQIKAKLVGFLGTFNTSITVQTNQVWKLLTDCTVQSAEYWCFYGMLLPVLYKSSHWLGLESTQVTFFVDLTQVFYLNDLTWLESQVKMTLTWLTPPHFVYKLPQTSPGAAGFQGENNPWAGIASECRKVGCLTYHKFMYWTHTHSRLSAWKCGIVNHDCALI